MDNQKIIVTVSGTDKCGVVAAVTTILAKHKVNIEDIKQTLMQGHFGMFLLANLSDSESSFKEIKQSLQDLGNQLEMEVWVQRKGIFDKMHMV